MYIPSEDSTTEIKVHYMHEETYYRRGQASTFIWKPFCNFMLSLMAAALKLSPLKSSHMESCNMVDWWVRWAVNASSKENSLVQDGDVAETKRTAHSHLLLPHGIWPLRRKSLGWSWVYHDNYPHLRGRACVKDWVYNNSNAQLSGRASWVLSHLTEHHHRDRLCPSINMIHSMCYINGSLYLLCQWWSQAVQP